MLHYICTTVVGAAAGELCSTSETQTLAVGGVHNVSECVLDSAVAVSVLPTVSNRTGMFV